MNIGFNLKLAALTLKNRVRLCFEGLKPSIDFSSLAMKIWDDIFFQCKAILSTLKNLSRVAVFVNYFS